MTASGIMLLKLQLFSGESLKGNGCRVAFNVIFK